MSSRYEYGQVSVAEDVSNSEASVDLVSDPGDTVYLYLEKLNISVYRAATGGGGIIRVQDTDGGVIWTASADGVKDILLDWGTEGLKLGPGLGLQVIVANAQGEQASASVGVKGHLAFR